MDPRPAAEDDEAEKEARSLPHEQRPSASSHTDLLRQPPSAYPRRSRTFRPSRSGVGSFAWFAATSATRPEDIAGIISREEIAQAVVQNHYG